MHYYSIELHARTHTEGENMASKRKVKAEVVEAQASATENVEMTEADKELLESILEGATAVAPNLRMRRIGDHIVLVSDVSKPTGFTSSGNISIASSGASLYVPNPVNKKIKLQLNLFNVLPKGARQKNKERLDAGEDLSPPQKLW